MKCGKQLEKVRKEMKKLILILLLLTPVWAFTQTHTFTEKEVVEMDSLFQVYEQTDSLQKLEINLLKTQISNYKTLHIQDSLHIAFMNEKTDLLNQRIDLYIDLTLTNRKKTELERYTTLRNNIHLKNE